MAPILKEENWESKFPPTIPGAEGGATVETDEALETEEAEATETKVSVGKEEKETLLSRTFQAGLINLNPEIDLPMRN